MKFVPLYYAPNLDNAWSVAPGALSDINGLAPLIDGQYASMGYGNYITAMTGDDIYAAFLVRKIGNTVRLLVGRSQNIDEYDSAGTRTNRATGLVATVDWMMCAQGDAVIAVSPQNATLVSTGAGFAALGGGSPKAKHCASNFGFVMLANTDTSSDQTWWSALNNYTSFTPSIATEAGSIRLLEAPGPITALVPYRDGFAAFKDNALFIAEYTGPNYIWKWRCLSHRVGCVGKRAVCELDGKLYFLHSSGFYEFDGQNIRNIGLPVHKTFLSQFARLISINGNTLVVDIIYDSLPNTTAAADDIEGVVWFHLGSNPVFDGGNPRMFGYNARAGKWTKYEGTSVGGGVVTTNPYTFLAMTTSADIQAFKADQSGRILLVCPITGAAASKIRAYRYPYDFVAADNPLFTTGVFGSFDNSNKLKRIFHRTTFGTDSGAITGGTVTGYTSENQLLTNGTKTGQINAELDVVDFVISSKFAAFTYAFPDAKTLFLAGLAPDYGDTKR